MQTTMLASAACVRVRTLAYRFLLVALGSSACSGPDNLTDPVVSADSAAALGGGATTVATGGSTSLGGSTATGGTTLGGTATTTALGGGTQTTTAPFDWGTNTYDATLGAAVSYQGHYTGTACATCHPAATASFDVGGTAYLADAVTLASSVEIGIFIDGALSYTYAGTQGNFYMKLPSAGSWATAQIALRNATGTLVMPVNASASGNCNSCHDATNRIVTP